ncbi:MAG: hypothetical protein ACRCVT_12000, partial [Leadbetterella sp.]
MLFYKNTGFEVETKMFSDFHITFQIAKVILHKNTIDLKLFPGLLQAIQNTIYEIFIGGKKADRAIGSVLKSNPKWGARDRAFVAENTYEIVRNWRKICFLSNMKMYETIQIEDIENIVAHYFFLQEGTDKNLPLFEDIDTDQVWKLEKEAKKSFVLEYSIPDWLLAVGQNQLGQPWEK